VGGESQVYAIRVHLADMRDVPLVAHRVDGSGGPGAAEPQAFRQRGIALHLLQGLVDGRFGVVLTVDNPLKTLHKRFDELASDGAFERLRRSVLPDLQKMTDERGCQRRLEHETERCLETCAIHQSDSPLSILCTLS
jgi:hypothetical protein